MIVEKLIQKIFEKPNFILSKKVPISYIIIVGLEFIIGILRGYIRKLGLGDVGKKLIIGKRTKLLVKNKIFLGNNVRIGEQCVINALSEEGVHLGDNVKIGSFSHLLVSGTVSNLGKGLWIGNNSSFSEYTFFGAAGGLTIGNDVIAGQNVRFHAENHNFSDNSKLIRHQGVSRKGIKIGNNVWVGAGVVFLDGAEVGNNCVIGANSLVIGKFDDNSVIIGSPAKKVKSI